MSRQDGTKTVNFTLQDIDRLVEQLRKRMASCQIITFTGPLGAGKTTVIKHLLRACGVTQTVTSPTFTYVNCYQNDQRQRFCHFDLYRIESLEQFLQAGFDEYLYVPNSWCFIEWPAPIMAFLKQGVCHVTLSYAPEPDARVACIRGGDDE